MYSRCCCWLNCSKLDTSRSPPPPPPHTGEDYMAVDWTELGGKVPSRHCYLKFLLGYRFACAGAAKGTFRHLGREGEHGHLP